MKVIPGEVQHGLVVTYIDRRKSNGHMTWNNVLRRRLWKLKEISTTQFQTLIAEFGGYRIPDLWKPFKDGVLNACDKVCGKKVLQRNRGSI